MFSPPFPPTSEGRSVVQPTAPFPSQASNAAYSEPQQTQFLKPLVESSNGHAAAHAPTSHLPIGRLTHHGSSFHSSNLQPSTPLNGAVSSGTHFQAAQSSYVNAPNSLQFVQSQGPVILNKPESHASVGQQSRAGFPSQPTNPIFNMVNASQSSSGENRHVPQFQGAPSFHPPISRNIYPNFPNVMGGSGEMAHSQNACSMPRDVGPQPPFGVQQTDSGFIQNPTVPPSGYPNPSPMQLRQPQPQPQRLDPNMMPSARPPPLIDLGPGGPVRCQRCKAYMCPFMEFQDGGRRFRCPFCHASTPVEDVYFAHLDHTGRRTDIDQRPELFLGAYEFIATKQYCKNGLTPKEPAFIFMIDVSYNATQNGMLQVLCSNLDRILERLPKEFDSSVSVVHVGLATFDQVVHFFDLSAPQPSMMVVGDVNDMFVPIVDGLLLPYSQAIQSIRAVLAEIPRLFASSKVTETILGPVVQAGSDALQCADRVGKLLIFSTSLPTFEAPGKLKARNDRNLLGSEKEKVALMPQGEFYTKLGEQCVKAGVTVDLFLFPNSFVDVASIAQLSAITGGNVYKYQYFVVEKDAPRFLADLSHDVSRQIAFDCMARIRSSAGIRPVTFQGSFFMENTTDLEMASIDEDKSFFAELKHDDKLSDQSAVIQCAILFTSVSGQRRLRILNLCLPVSSDYNQLYRVADHGALVSYFLKNAVQMNRERGLKEMKEHIFQRCAQILAAYREKVSESAPLGQLILPETLKLLPLFINSIVKNDSICGGSEMTVDDKVWMIELIRGMRMDHTMLLLYPKIVPVDHLELLDPSEITSVVGSIRASYENLSHTKAYLIDNGIVLFLWIGLGINETWMNEIFGVNSVAMLDTENAYIPEKDNTRSRGLRRVIELVQQTGPRSRKLFIVREKDALEPWMKKFLVEDRTGPNAMSYVDFLCYIHREIRNVLA
ncbi:Sec23/Sec24 trunk domain protein [Dictyocaulus viviparus]|uniref:Sec23/Sec24 trunk domain protein n=1 Tax=Dictyocaulus viviparus TaxID=29172 RepID=A0A0D8XM88_DICVI|nr:Sec23/Sec24 trunk domain protein [Dictyocaulus viviparus]